MRRAKKNVPSAKRRRIEHEAEAGLSGALAGAAAGALAGPPGAITGAVIGGVVGLLAGAALENDEARASARDAKLDEDIGVSGGDLGAPNLEHPPATRGTYSAAACGSGGRESAPPSGGPMQSPD